MDRVQEPVAVPSSELEEDAHVEHPELFHYTNWDGLYGIIRSQELWATHYTGLNDLTEVEHLRQYLTDEVAVHLAPKLKTLASSRLSIPVRPPR